MPSPVLVINPYVTDFKLYDEWMHPLGLYFLLALLERNGIETRFFNCLHQGGQTKKYSTGEFPFHEIEKPALYKDIPRKYKRYGCPESELRSFLESTPNPRLICVGTMMTHWLPGVAHTLALIREVHPKVPIVAGGTAARLMPEAVARMVSGLSIGGTAAGSGLLQLHPDLPPCTREEHSSLIPAFRAVGAMPHGPALLTLGCPMACSFCASLRLQGPFRVRPISLAIEETRWLMDHAGVTDFAFYDDALLFDADRGLLPFLREFSSNPPRFHAPNGLHLRFVNEETAAALKQAGFATLRFGFESGSSRYAGDTSGKTGYEGLKHAVFLLAQAGFAKRSVGVYVMGGLPRQTPEQVIEEMKAVAACGVLVKPVFLSPVPGTALFDRYAADFPEITGDPLWHNDTFFITRLPGWNWEAVEQIRLLTRELNRL